ncbi:MAG: hypothetical protein R2911_37405 [Caldilineaceae bacterium]
MSAQVDASALTTATLAAAASFGQVEVNLPPGAVGDPTRLVMSTFYTPTEPAPENKVLIGRGFRLEAYRDNQPQPGFRVGETISLTVPFSLSASSQVDANTLQLHAWDGSQWSADGLTCAVDSGQNVVKCTADTPTLTQFALFADAPVAGCSRAIRRALC